MINKVLSFFDSAKLIQQKSSKNFVNIACKSNSNLSEEFEILQNAKGVIENFAKKNNIKVDLFFRESNDNNINKQIVDITVADRKTGSPAQKSIVYKEDNKPIKFITQKPYIRWVEAENEEYIKTVKSPPMKITGYNTIKNRVTTQEVKMPDIKICVKVYKNYSIPKKVGVGRYEDSFLRYVYRVIEVLEQVSKKRPTIR